MRARASALVPPRRPPPQRSAFLRATTSAAVAAGLAVAPNGHSAQAAPSVWAIDDGEKIRRDATSTPFERGEQNPVWRPGEPVRLFAVRNEVVALQVVIEAAEEALTGVEVDLTTLSTGNGATLDRVDRFVEHFVRVRRPSGGRTPDESLGWEAGAGPAPTAWVGDVPDALIPVEWAPSWAPYPLRVEARTNGIVWVDIDVGRDQPPGVYRGAIVVASEGAALSSIPVELDVETPVLPEPAAEATVFYDPEELERRIGPGAEEPLWRLLHAHRVSPLHNATSAADVARQKDALTGATYGSASGYAGPGTSLGDGVLAIGAYGGLGEPDASKLARVEAIADAAAEAKVLGGTDVFVYADDERCHSARGAAWRELLRGSRDPNVRGIRVAWTCTEDPSEQPVDIPMLLARYEPAQGARARSRGKEVWLYNGVLPRTGTFLLDADAVSPRINGWLAAMYGIRRWFYWESTYWYGQHGKTAIDPFVEPETLRNDDGDWANGDGVLVYPGLQEDAFHVHSLGYRGVLPSIRLKSWRRGLQDAAYLELARARDRLRADAVARALIPTALGAAPRGRPPPWSARGIAFYGARRALLAIALGEGTRGVAAAPPTRGARRLGWAVLAGGVLLAAGYALVRKALTGRGRCASGSPESRDLRARPATPSRSAQPSRRPIGPPPSRRGAARIRLRPRLRAGSPAGAGRQRTSR